MNALCNVVQDVQVISSVTSYSTPAIQLVYISTTFTGSSAPEIQQVVCDATGGSFQLSFGGYTTQSIQWNANTGSIVNALQQLEIVNSVVVNFPAGTTTACGARGTLTGGVWTPANPNQAFTVTFTNVVNMNGNMPLMTATQNNLQGSRYTAVTRTQAGQASLGGSFRLSFRGFSTADIVIPATAQDIMTKLNDLDSIPSAGVFVSQLTGSVGPTNTNSRLWAVTFTNLELGGNVEALQSVDAYNLLTGTNVAIQIFASGTETSLARGGGSTSSVVGNEIAGTFTLTYRSHTTQPIDFNAADTELKARLEALPNVGTVKVVRTGPSVWKEYQWTVTFISMPGAYPYGTGSLPQLVPAVKTTANVVTLTGSSTVVNMAHPTTGSLSIGGTFSLTMTTISNNINVAETASSIPADASASELAAYLNQLNTVGTVSVSRTSVANGYKWLVTFDGCKIVNGTDVCNEGNVALLIATNQNIACAASPLTVSEVIPGSGPANTCGSSGSGTGVGLCVDYVTDLSGAAPYSYLMTSLSAGLKYYVQVSAHNREGFGYPAITTPEFQVPTYNPPGSPPPVRLVSSTSSSITVEWDFPRENGGATVMGFELWMDDWAGGNPRLVFDGTDQPTTTSFTVSTSTSLIVVSGQSYRFMVRAINYCVAASMLVVLDQACYSQFSATSVFVVRAPRVPLAPPMPYHSAKSNIGASYFGDAQITIRWPAAIDNGGSILTAYYVYYAAPGVTTYTQVILQSIPVPASMLTADGTTVTNTANGIQLMEYTVNNLKEGNVYRFYTGKFLILFLLSFFLIYRLSGIIASPKSTLFYLFFIFPIIL